MNSAPTLLLVDDDAAWRDRLAKALAARGFEVATAASVDEALARPDEAPEYAVVDLRMPGRSGLELLKALRAKDPATRVLVLTGYGSIPTAVEATRLGAVGYLSKPCDADEVVRALLLPAGAAEQSPALETPTLARAEWEYIHRVLADCGDNISEAARRLGVHRRVLQRKLQKYPPTR
jgi:two-component system, response regulator RegA